jgi:hypothetical protein
MNRGKALVLAMVLLISGRLFGIEVIDTIHTTTGEVYAGRIVERYPGTEYHIETQDGTRTVPVSQIDRIEKTLPPSDSQPFIFKDIVFLESGLSMEGAILEEAPGSHIVLLTDNGVALTIPIEQIWRVTHQKRAAIVSPSGQGSNTRIDDVRREFQIRVTVRRLEGAQSPTGGDDSADSVTELQEELELLEEESRVHREEQALDELFLEQILGEINASEVSAADIAGELARRAAACAVDNQEALDEIATLYVSALDNVSEVAALAASLTSVDPGVVRQMRLAESEANLAELAILMDGGFRDRANSERLQYLSQRTSIADRQALAEASQIDSPFASLVYNAIVPFGIGSAKQGDIVGTVIEASTVGIGGALLFPTLTASLETGRPLQLDTLGWIGTAIAGAGYLYSLARPFLYTASHNRAVDQALGLGGQNR